LISRTRSSTDDSSSADQVTIYDSVGFALEDYSALRYMRDVAAELKMTETISLIPTLANPKDLFGFLAKNRGAKRPLLAAVAVAA
jgi:ornithine cyclodeaminase